MRSLRPCRERGFTLIELAVVIVVAGILAAVAIPIYRSFVEDAKWSEASTAMGSLRTAVDAYSVKYPNEIDTIDIPAGGSGTPADWMKLGIAENTWAMQHFTVENFGLTTNADGTWLLSCNPATGAPGANPPSDPGSITVDDENTWTLTGGAQ